MAYLQNFVLVVASARRYSGALFAWHRAVNEQTAPSHETENEFENQGYQWGRAFRAAGIHRVGRLQVSLAGFVDWLLVFGVNV